MTAREYIISKHPELAEKERMKLMDANDLEKLMEEWLVYLNEIDYETSEPIEPIDAFENIRNIYFNIKMKRL